MILENTNLSILRFSWTLIFLEKIEQKLYVDVTVFRKHKSVVLKFKILKFKISKFTLISLLTLRNIDLAFQDLSR